MRNLNSYINKQVFITTNRAICSCWLSCHQSGLSLAWVGSTGNESELAASDWCPRPCG